MLYREATRRSIMLSPHSINQLDTNSQAGLFESRSLGSHIYQARGGTKGVRLLAYKQAAFNNSKRYDLPLWKIIFLFFRHLLFVFCCYNKIPKRGSLFKEM